MAGGGWTICPSKWDDGKRFVTEHCGGAGAGGGWKADKQMEAAVTLLTSKADGADGADKETEAAVTPFQLPRD